MMAITLIFSVPLAFSVRFENVNRWVAVVSGVSSVLIGGMLMSDVAAGTDYLAFLPQ
jgi:uncharacterized membrane protein HdeD (DUF308 family)